MAKQENSGKTVAKILMGKRAAIKNAPLDPSWDDILDLTWEQIEERARKGWLGYKTFKKLLKERRFNKPKRRKK